MRYLQLFEGKSSETLLWFIPYMTICKWALILKHSENSIHLIRITWHSTCDGFFKICMTKFLCMSITAFISFELESHHECLRQTCSEFKYLIASLTGLYIATIFRQIYKKENHLFQSSLKINNSEGYLSNK